jgi:hypothetical protein
MEGENGKTNISISANGRSEPSVTPRNKFEVSKIVDTCDYGIQTIDQEQQSERIRMMCWFPPERERT